MNQPLLMLPLCLVLAVPIDAQTSRRSKTQKPTADRKDDGITAKDKAIVAIDKFIKGKGKPSKADGWRQRLKKPPMVKFDKNSEYFWHMKTNVGDIQIKLLPDVAPMHVSSTIYLARTGFYDGISFHRVIKGFMAQAGCPLGRGTAGPGYNYDGEYDPKVKHDTPGLLSMANTGRPGSDGSQFFLTFVPTPHLNGRHTIFGKVIGKGMATVRTLEKAGSPSGKTSKPLRMERTWIRVKPRAGARSMPKKTKPATSRKTKKKDK